MINERTVAVLATHVYGNPCDVYAIEKIAKAHNLKVIYDGAHAFDAKLDGKQILSFGDIATCSFHATKIFHTIEGGAVVTNNDELAEKMTLYRQFGHIGDNHISIGINGKSSEFHAAMGLCLLPKVEQFIAKRKLIAALYDESLKDLGIQWPVALNGTSFNYSYYPIIVDSEARLFAIRAVLEKNNIFTRRYFYPSLNDLPQYKGEPCPVSESVSIRALALPMYYTLPEEDVLKICDLIKTCF